MDILSNQAQKAIDTICKWRPTIIGAPNPLPVPDPEEALRYLATLKACSESPHQTIKQEKGNEDLRQRRRNRSPKKGEGWRDIGDRQVWFENAWHANYARFIDRVPEIISKWTYRPNRKFKIGPFGYYSPTFWVQYAEGGESWVEIDSHKESIETKAQLLDCYYPEERVFILDRKTFLKDDLLFRANIAGWESMSTLSN